MVTKKKTSDLVICEDLMKRVFEQNNQEFFSYAWRESVVELLSSESKYSRLLEWINERLSFEFSIINTFNPADKESDYTKKQMKTYLKACETVGVLLNAKYIIMSDTCTTKMRENWEYTLCKLYGISYNKDLGYV